MSDAEQLDTALEEGGRAAGDELASLVQLAAEITHSLSREWLSPWEREVIYDRALQLARRSRRWTTARRALLDHRVRAAAGGAAVTIAAATAIGIALLRQRRQQHAPIAV